MAAQLTEKARAFLNEQRFAVLATINKDGTPQQTVMWYELQGDEIMMNTARGRLKDRNLDRDPRISICVEDGQRFVTLRGTVTLDDTVETAQADIKRLATRYQGAEQAEQMSRNQFGKEHRITLRMKIEGVLENGV
ncbi:MAG: PPOX class F420-dependent oxidoreductase [Thermomicrobia bacterium]|nr:PPOX class F420-dependent oxidoreductase [Thermomicrobia bacterium]MCA1724922.1 PPOX class F420-dependent oxidoreductase [Thermomicrobia bacterium]